MKILLVDFMNTAFRAYYAYNAQMSFTSSDGTPTGMTYGLLSMTLSLIRDTGATHVAFAAESRTRTGNAAMVEAASQSSPVVGEAFKLGYKGGRKEMDPLLRSQLDLAEEACWAMGWPVHRIPGYEADDVLATMARQAERLGGEAVIATGDQDLWQCVTDKVSVWAAKAGGVYLDVNPKTVPLFMDGLRADQIPDYKAIAGDASDGYPGCPGIGHKGAVRLLLDHGSVDGVYSHIDEIKGATRTRLVEFEPLVRLCRNLATLETEGPYLLDPDTCRVPEEYPDSAVEFIKSLGMASILRRMGA